MFIVCLLCAYWVFVVYCLLFIMCLLLLLRSHLYCIMYGIGDNCILVIMITISTVNKILWCYIILYHMTYYNIMIIIVIIIVIIIMIIISSSMMVQAEPGAADTILHYTILHYTILYAILWCLNYIILYYIIWLIIILWLRSRRNPAPPKSIITTTTAININK